MVVTAAVVLAAGVAWATIPDASGVIHGCYGDRGWGRLRVIDPAAGGRCKAWETAIDWNQVGPPGPQGPPGPPGPQGPAGQSASASVYQVAEDGVWVLNAANQWRTVVDLTVPAGDFAVFGKTAFVLSSGCRLIVGQQVLDESVDSLDGGNLSLLGSVELPNGGTIELQCNSGSTVNNQFRWSSILAMTVGDIN